MEISRIQPKFFSFDDNNHSTSPRTGKFFTNEFFSFVLLSTKPKTSNFLECLLQTRNHYPSLKYLMEINEAKIDDYISTLIIENFIFVAIPSL